MRISQSTTRMKKLLLLLLFFPSLVFADYSMTIFQVPGHSPLDGTNYVYTSNSSAAPGSTSCSPASAGQAGLVLKTGTVTDITINYAVAGTLPTAEPLSIWFAVNGTDVYTLSASSTVLSASNRSNIQSWSGLSIAVTTGDLVCFHVLTPAWATNPTSVSWYSNIKVSEGTAASATASATSTSINYNPGDFWFYGFVIFFVCMAFPIWLFRRK